jgi:hypothetical protein
MYSAYSPAESDVTFTELNHRIALLKAEREHITEQRDKDVTALNEQLQAKTFALVELNRKVVMNNTALVSWFQDNVNETEEDEDITISLEDINAILTYIGLDPISRIREWAVEVTYSNTATIYVKASSEDEANEKVENASFWVETDGDFLSADFESYNSEITIDNTYVSP